MAEIEFNPILIYNELVNLCVKPPLSGRVISNHNSASADNSNNNNVNTNVGDAQLVPSLRIDSTTLSKEVNKFRACDGSNGKRSKQLAKLICKNLNEFIITQLDEKLKSSGSSTTNEKNYSLLNETVEKIYEWILLSSKFLEIKKSNLEISRNNFHFLKKTTKKPAQCHHSKPDWKTPSELDSDRKIFNDHLIREKNHDKELLKTDLVKAWLHLNKILTSITQLEATRDLILGKGCVENLSKFMKEHRDKTISFNEHWTPIAETYKKNNKSKKSNNNNNATSAANDVEDIDVAFGAFTNNCRNAISLFKKSFIDKACDNAVQFGEEAQDILLDLITEAEKRVTGEGVLDFHSDLLEKCNNALKTVKDIKLMILKRISIMRSEIAKKENELIQEIDALENGWANESQKTLQGRLEKANNKEFRKRIKKFESAMQSKRQFVVNSINNLLSTKDFTSICISCLEIFMMEGEVLEAMQLRIHYESYDERLKKLSFQREILLKDYRQGVDTETFARSLPVPPGLDMYTRDINQTQQSVKSTAPKPPPLAMTTPPQIKQLLSTAQESMQSNHQRHDNSFNDFNFDDLGKSDLVLLVQNLINEKSQLVTMLVSMQQDVKLITNYSSLLRDRDRELQALQMMEARKQLEMEEALKYIQRLEFRIAQLENNNNSEFSSIQKNDGSVNTNYPIVNNKYKPPRRNPATSSRIQSVRCGNCGEQGHVSQDCKIGCRYCGDLRHLSEYCTTDIKLISRFHHSATVLDKTIYMIGGLSSFGNNDNNNNLSLTKNLVDFNFSELEVNEKNSNLSVTGHGAIHLDGSKVLIFFGQEELSPKIKLSDPAVKLVDVKTGTVTVPDNIKGQTPVSRYHHSTTLIDNKIYIIGGLDKDNNPLSDIAYLDLSSNTWILVNTQQFPIAGHSTTAIDHYLISCFGFSGSNKLTSNCNVYDTSNSSYLSIQINGNENNRGNNELYALNTSKLPALLSWTPITISSKINPNRNLIPSPRGGHTAFTINDKKNIGNNDVMMIWGGYSDNNLVDSEIYFFDVKSSSWIDISETGYLDNNDVLPDSNSGSRSSNVVLIIGGIVIAATLLVIIITVGLFLMRKKIKLQIDKDIQNDPYIRPGGKLGSNSDLRESTPPLSPSITDDENDSEPTENRQLSTSISSNISMSDAKNMTNIPDLPVLPSPVTPKETLPHKIKRTHKRSSSVSLTAYDMANIARAKKFTFPMSPLPVENVSNVAKSSSLNSDPNRNTNTPFKWRSTDDEQEVVDKRGTSLRNSSHSNNNNNSQDGDYIIYGEYIDTIRKSKRSSKRTSRVSFAPIDEKIEYNESDSSRSVSLARMSGRFSYQSSSSSISTSHSIIEEEEEELDNIRDNNNSNKNKHSPSTLKGLRLYDDHTDESKISRLSFNVYDFKIDDVPMPENSSTIASATAPASKTTEIARYS
ncbi:3232_t:CDS:2 [Entrophospora sp. SA101]|nr:3232_t:CDS:2 [Entrophospora sp. SA101]